MDEQELEATLRGGLASRAEGADVTAPVVARVRHDVSRRRRTRWGMGAAAASVVLVAGGVAAVTAGGDSGGEQPRVSDPTAGDVAPGDVTEWRTEYWADVAVDVPADWGYGGAPMRSRPTPVACYPAASVGPDGTPTTAREEQSLGWVGRPIGLTDVCAGYPWIEHSPQEEPAAPYVWLGAAVEPGIVEYDNGYMEETVLVNGSTVTVASDDAQLREEILATARGGETCMANLLRVPEGRWATTVEGRGELLEAQVCAYTLGSFGEFVLSYAAALSPADAATALSAAESAPAATFACEYEPFEFVVLRAVYDDPFGQADLDRTVVYEMGCGGTVDLGSRTLYQMTPDVLEPWAGGGIRAIVHGPSSAPWVYDYFIGMQG